MGERYNGWTNRETWLVGVHSFFDDDQIWEVIQDRVDALECAGNVGRLPPESKRLPWQKDLPFVRRLGYRKEDKVYAVFALDDKLGGEARAMEFWLADWMRDYHEDFIDTATWNLDTYVTDFIADNEINWLEIAEHYDEQIAEALSHCR